MQLVYGYMHLLRNELLHFAGNMSMFEGDETKGINYDTGSYAESEYRFDLIDGVFLIVIAVEIFFTSYVYMLPISSRPKTAIETSHHQFSMISNGCAKAFTGENIPCRRLEDRAEAYYDQKCG